jgi:flagellar motor switch protein FliM
MAQSNVQPRTTPLSVTAIRSISEGSADSLAMIPKSFGRFALALSKSVLDFAPVAPSFSYENHSQNQTVEFDETAQLSELLICSEVRHAVRVTADRSAIFGICDAVFGGVGNEPAFVESRPFSQIERATIRLLFCAVGRALPLAFAAFSEFSVAPKQDPNDDPLFPPFKPFVSITILCNIHGYSGEISIELPQELAVFFKPVASQKQEAGAAPLSEWAPQISARMEGIEVELTALLAEFSMNLDGVTCLQKGQVVKLHNTVASPLTLHVEGVTLFTAKLGQTANKFCLSIEKPVMSLR